MAISPADFYAYSRATGVPVPESDEERAQMAGDVINFRRNQLRAPAKQEDEGRKSRAGADEHAGIKRENSCAKRFR